MRTCNYCDQKFASAASLSSHKYKYHKDLSEKPNVVAKPKYVVTKPNVVAITNVPTTIESRQNPRKVITAEDERREKKMMAKVLNLSDSDSDTDDSISLLSEGGNNPSTSNKRNHTPNSSDEEPPLKVSRKKITRITKISESDSDDGTWLFSNEGDNPNTLQPQYTSTKRIRTPNSSDEEPPSKVARKKPPAKSKKRKRNRVASDDSNAPRRKSRKKSVIREHNKDGHVLSPKAKPVPVLSPISRKTKRLSDFVNEQDRIREAERVAELEEQVAQLKTDLNVQEILQVPKLQYSKELVAPLNAQIADLKQENEALRSVRTRQDAEITELEELLEREKAFRAKEKEQSDLLAKQLEDCNKNVISEMTPLDKALNNSVTIEEINEIRHLMKTNNLEAILNDVDKLSTIQKIISGMLEGVIPLSNPQNLAFSKNQRSFMIDLQNEGLDNMRDLIIENSDDFFEVFQILDMSLKLVIKAFNKYGQNTYK